ncbi:hypothetical protein FRB93_003176 [Tulasnella sp. JGI-2019a]|nr:hypothetical protein FRB93_003176 [Tulasnella sp. JGI-2019a]
MLDTLESVLEDCDSIPADESAAFNPDFRSWTKNREMLRRSITTLRVLTFEDYGRPVDSLSAAFRHDDQSWLDVVCKHISIFMSPGMKYSTNAPDAFSTLLEIKESLNRSNYEPAVFEATVRLASNIYTLLDLEDPNEKRAWDMVQIIAGSLRDIRISGDILTLGDLVSSFVTFDRLIADELRVPEIPPRIGSATPQLEIGRT